jgi:hypothetical protein
MKKNYVKPAVNSKYIENENLLYGSIEIDNGTKIYDSSEVMSKKSRFEE